MKARVYSYVLSIGLLFCMQACAQNPVNWTNNQLMSPAELVTILNSNKSLPLIFSVGPAATIPHSVEIGMVKDKDKLDKFKKQ